MPTVINNPTTTDSDSHGINWVVALVLILAVFFLLFYGLPALRSGTFFSIPANPSQPQSQNRIDVNAPGIDVPDEVNINTNPGNTNPNPGQ